MDTLASNSDRSVTFCNKTLTLFQVIFLSSSEESAYPQIQTPLLCGIPGQNIIHCLVKVVYRSILNEYNNFIFVLFTLGTVIQIKLLFSGWIMLQKHDLFNFQFSSNLVDKIDRFVIFFPFY